MELARLRVKGVDFGYKSLIIRDGKGNKNRVVMMLPEKTIEPLQAVIAQRKTMYEQDKAQDYARVYIPEVLARNYPNAEHGWIWQYVFTAPNISADPRSGEIRRHHVYEQSIQRAVRQAAHDARLMKPYYTPALCATALPRTYLKVAMTSAPFKNYWGTNMLKQQRFTRMCLNKVGEECKVRLMRWHFNIFNHKKTQGQHPTACVLWLAIASFWQVV